MRKLHIALLMIVLIPFLLFSGASVHECGHAITAALCGQKVHQVTATGIQVYPRLKLLPWQVTNSSKAVYDSPPVLWQDGLSLFMGSGLTTLVGYLVLGGILIFHPRRWGWAVAGTTVLVFTGDMIAYAIFPQLGLRHGILIGGGSAEPVEGASLMGVPPWVFNILLTIHILLVYGLLLRYALHLRRTAKTPPGGSTDADAQTR